jgi:hypothetical protein
VSTTSTPKHLNLLRRVRDDLRQARHIEAYSVALLTLILTVFSLVDEPPAKLTNAAILTCLAFLVLWTIDAREGKKAVSLDTVLRDRQSYGSFDDLLKGAKELWMYAPTGVNVLLRYAAEIREWVAKGGQARIVVQDPSGAALESVRTQLDSNVDFDSSLSAALATLTRLSSHPHVEFRLLAVNPGFSMVVLDPADRSGRVLVEFHGFQDKSIADRMHIEIRRSDSLRWFEYWTGRFEAIWEAAHAPTPPVPHRTGRS